MITEATPPADRSAPTIPSPLTLVARLVELALIALIAYLGAQAVWFVVYGDAVRPLDLDTDISLGAGASVRVTDMSILSQSSLFAARGSLEPVVAQIAPETRLNLTLRGVRSGPDPRLGAAFIDAPNLGQRSYASGDEITDGVVLEEIYEDRVIINRRGARESLFISDEAAERARTGQSRPASGRAAAISTPSRATPLSGEPDLELARSLDVEDWIEGLRLAPFSQGGSITGFVVRDTSHLEILRAAGLQPGDVITVLNGQRLVDADAARRALARFETEDSLSMTLMRDGAPVQVNVPLN